MRYCDLGEEKCVFGKGFPVGVSFNMTMCSDCRKMWFMDSSIKSICNCILGCICEKKNTIEIC